MTGEDSYVCHNDTSSLWLKQHAKVLQCKDIQYFSLYCVVSLQIDGTWFDYLLIETIKLKTLKK